MSHASPIQRDRTSKIVLTFRTTWNSSSPDIANINTCHFLGVFFLLPLTGNSSNVVTSESDQYIAGIFFSSPHIEVNKEGGYLRLKQREVCEYEQFSFVGQK